MGFAGLMFQHVEEVVLTEKVGDHCNVWDEKWQSEVPRPCRNAADLKVAAAVMSRIFTAFCYSLLQACASLSCNSHRCFFVQTGFASLLAYCFFDFLYERCGNLFL